MTKLTIGLRNEIAAALRSYDQVRGYERDSYGQRLLELSAIAITLDVEEEPVMWAEARDAAEKAGWVCIHGYGRNFFFRGPEHFEVFTKDKGSIVASTRYAPTDLLDGRLAALDNAKEEA